MSDTEQYIISLGVGRPPSAKCTCGWSYGPDADLFKLGTEAFNHMEETGHTLRKPPESQDD